MTREPFPRTLLLSGLATVALLFWCPPVRAQQASGWKEVASCTLERITERRIVSGYELTRTQEASCNGRSVKLDLRLVRGGTSDVMLSFEDEWLEIDEDFLRQDLTGASHPHLAVLRQCSGSGCDLMFSAVELGPQLREILSLQLDQAALVPVAGSNQWALRVVEHWWSDRCTQCGAYPVSFLRYDGSRYVADPELMRAPLDEATATKEGTQLREAFSSPYGYNDSDAGTDLFARLTYTGNLTGACRIYFNAWEGTPAEKSAAADFIVDRLRSIGDDKDAIPGLARALAILNGVPTVSDLSCPPPP